MKSALISLTCERERLKQCLDQETCPPTSPQVVGLKNALTTVNNTHSHTDTDVWAAAGYRCPLSFRLSHSSQMSWPLTRLVRSDTLASRLEGLLVLPTCTMFQESWLLPPNQRHFLFSLFCLHTVIVMLSSFELLCSLRQHISLTLIPCWVLAFLPDYSAATYFTSHRVSNVWVILFGLLWLSVWCLQW